MSEVTAFDIIWHIVLFGASVLFVGWLYRENNNGEWDDR